jgi:uncharacterized membrane protein YsdA (DUF1294 family)
MAQRKHDPWEDFKPIRAERPKAGPITSLLLLLLVTAFCAGAGYVVAVLYTPGVTRSQQTEYRIEDTPQRLKTRGLIGAGIGALVGVSLLAGHKIKTMRGE